MKKNISILIIFLSFLLSQSGQPYPPVTLVSIPTAGTLPKGYFSFENVFMKHSETCCARTYIGKPSAESPISVYAPPYTSRAPEV